MECLSTTSALRHAAPRNDAIDITCRHSQGSFRPLYFLTKAEQYKLRYPYANVLPVTPQVARGLQAF